MGTTLGEEICIPKDAGSLPCLFVVACNLKLDTACIASNERGKRAGVA